MSDQAEIETEGDLLFLSVVARLRLFVVRGYVVGGAWGELHGGINWPSPFRCNRSSPWLFSCPHVFVIRFLPSLSCSPLLLQAGIKTDTGDCDVVFVCACRVFWMVVEFANKVNLTGSWDDAELCGNCVPLRQAHWVVVIHCLLSLLFCGSFKSCHECVAILHWLENCQRRKTL